MNFLSSDSGQEIDRSPRLGCDSCGILKSMDLRDRLRSVADLFVSRGHR